MRLFFKRLLKLFITFCFLILILVPLVLIVFNLWVLPSLFQDYIQSDLSRKFHLDLSYEKISYDPIHGIIFENLSMQRRKKADFLWAKARRTQIDIAFSSLIKRALVIKDFRINECEGRVVKSGKEPVLFSLKDVHGSLHQERLQNIGVGGWLGNFVLEHLSLHQKNLLIEQVRCVVSEREAVIRDSKIFWLGFPIKCEGLIDLLKKTADVAFNLYDSDFLFAHYETGKIQMGLFANETKVLSVSYLKNKFQKPFTSFQGFLSFEDFPPRIQPLKGKVLFKSPIKLGGWLVGSDFGEIFFDLHSVSFYSLVLEQLYLKLDFYRSRFLVKSLEVKSCKGFLMANGWIDLFSGAYKGWIKFERLSLNCLGPILFPKGDRFKGILSGDLTFLGFGNFGKNKSIDPLKNIEAEGNLDVQKGSLWKIQLMKGVLKVFEPISSLGKIRLKSGTAHYYIHLGDLLIQDLKLMSPTILMEYTGKMGLKEKNLDLDLRLSVKPLGLNGKTFLSRIVSGGLTMAGGQIWKAKISGTLEKPVITPLVLPVLQPVKDVLRIPFRPFQKKDKAEDRSE